MTGSTSHPRTDVLILGGGVVGLCAAYELAQRGAKVTLLEQAPRLGAGASWGNAGLVVPSHIIPLASPGVIAQGLRWMLNPESPFYIKPRPSLALLRWLWRFRKACTKQHVERASALLRDLHRRSLSIYSEYADELGLDFGFEKRGLLDLFITDKGFDHAQAEAAHLRALGVDAQILTANQAREREPAAGDKILGGIFFSEDAHLTPRRFLETLAERVRQAGVTIHHAAKVSAFERRGRTILAARTDRSRYEADQFLLATGAWSAALGQALRLRILIEPAKGYGVNVRRVPGLPAMPLRLGEAKVAVTPMGDTVRFAGTLELAGMDLSISPRRVDAIRRAAREYLNLAAAPDEIEVWRGLRPCTPDGLPLLGRPRRYDNLLLAAGHAMIGQSLGPVTGRLVAEMLTGRPIDLDLSPLDPDRFS